MGVDPTNWCERATPSDKLQRTCAKLKVTRLRRCKHAGSTCYWPPYPVTSASTATEEEAKVITEVLKTGQTKESADVMDQLLEKHDLPQGLRVEARVARFIPNCSGRQKLSGPLTKSEIDDVRRIWILLVQQRH